MRNLFLVMGVFIFSEISMALYDDEYLMEFLKLLYMLLVSVLFFFKFGISEKGLRFFSKIIVCVALIIILNIYQSESFWYSLIDSYRWWTLILISLFIFSMNGELGFLRENSILIVLCGLSSLVILYLFAPWGYEIGRGERLRYGLETAIILAPLAIYVAFVRKNTVLGLLSWMIGFYFILDVNKGKLSLLLYLIVTLYCLYLVFFPGYLKIKDLGVKLLTCLVVCMFFVDSFSLLFEASTVIELIAGVIGDYNRYYDSTYLRSMELESVILGSGQEFNQALADYSGLWLSDLGFYGFLYTYGFIGGVLYVYMFFSFDKYIKEKYGQDSRILYLVVFSVYSVTNFTLLFKVYVLLAIPVFVGMFFTKGTSVHRS